VDFIGEEGLEEARHKRVLQTSRLHGLPRQSWMDMERKYPSEKRRFHAMKAHDFRFS